MLPLHTTHRLLCSLHAVCAATGPSDRLSLSDDVANTYARRALFVAERHYGPVHAQTADSLYRLAASLCRRAEYPVGGDEAEKKCKK